MTGGPSFPELVQDFFCQRLMAQKNASTQTVISYRDTFRLLLRYAEDRLGKPPTSLRLSDLDASLVLSFLDHLETDRGNTVRSRNARLAAIRSFLHYAAHRDLACLPVVERALAIPMKRFDRPMFGFLSKEEIEAVLAAPDPATWAGQRDRVMFASLYNTGARVSEVTTLRRMDAQLDRSRCLHIRGKGRKQRTVPLWKSTASQLKNWMRCISPAPHAPLFPSRSGNPLSRSAVGRRLQTAVDVATKGCPTLKDRPISPHTLRHTTAMHLLQSGVDITVIALWLGHESPATTHLYVEADLKMKEQALKRVQPPTVKPARYRASDRLLAFLDGL